MQTDKNLTRMDIEILSDVLFLALHSDDYKDIDINTFYNRFIECIKVGDFQLLRDEKSGLPIAFTSWSFVSDEVLKDMQKTRRALKIEDINSGDNLLFIEFFSTNNDYWKFFDYLTDYFNNHYKGVFTPSEEKIYTCCGLKIDFDKAGIKITKTDNTLNIESKRDK